MLVLRSIAFTTAFYVNITLWMILSLPALAMPRWAVRGVVRAWAKSNLLLLRTLAGIRCEVRGRERVPPGGLLVAAKHQSVWETFALFLILDDPCYVLKRELTYLPLFGWLAMKARMVPVDRGARSAAMKSMTAAAKVEAESGRQIVIFPEGTRRAAGAEPAYKYGVAYLYSELDLPCLPVALNSGLFRAPSSSRSWSRSRQGSSAPPSSSASSTTSRRRRTGCWRRPSRCGQGGREPPRLDQAGRDVLVLFHDRDRDSFLCRNGRWSGIAAGCDQPRRPSRGIAAEALDGTVRAILCGVLLSAGGSS
jgi:1-acyl-sn-glycerol-3-phosphate acyltransferase